MPTKPLTAVLKVIGLAASLEQRFNPALGSIFGLSTRDYLFLLYLANAPKNRLRRVDLAAMLSIAQSSISHMGDPLEKRGLVTREADTHDARVSYAVLSKEGKKIVDEASAVMNDIAVSLFDERWSAKDLEQFAQRLTQLTFGSPSHLAVG